MKVGSFAATVLVGVFCVAAVAAYTTYPWTKRQCLQWAAERKGELPTLIALRACQEKFGDLAKQ